MNSFNAPARRTSRTFFVRAFLARAVLVPAFLGTLALAGCGGSDPAGELGKPEMTAAVSRDGGTGLSQAADESRPTSFGPNLTRRRFLKGTLETACAVRKQIKGRDRTTILIETAVGIAPHMRQIRVVVGSVLKWAGQVTRKQSVPSGESATGVEYVSPEFILRPGGKSRVNPTGAGALHATGRATLEEMGLSEPGDQGRDSILECAPA